MAAKSTVKTDKAAELARAQALLDSHRAQVRREALEAREKAERDAKQLRSDLAFARERHTAELVEAVKDRDAARVVSVIEAARESAERLVPGCAKHAPTMMLPDRSTTVLFVSKAVWEGFGLSKEPDIYEGASHYHKSAMKQYTRRQHPTTESMRLALEAGTVESWEICFTVVTEWLSLFQIRSGEIRDRKKIDG